MEMVFCSESNSFLRKKRRGAKGKGNKRSQMLKVVMPQLSGKLGEQLQDAIYAGDGARAERVMIQVAKAVRKKVESSK